MKQAGVTGQRKTQGCRERKVLIMAALAAEPHEDFNAEENTAHEEHIEIIRQEAEWFDLTPIEKKLCGASLGLGIALLAVFLVAFRL